MVPLYTHPLWSETDYLRGIKISSPPLTMKVQGVPFLRFNCRRNWIGMGDAFESNSAENEDRAGDGD